MALVSDEGIQVEVPHEPGCYFEFKTLAAFELDEARQVEAKKSRQAARDFGVEILKGLQSDDDEQRKGAKRAMDEMRYDRSQYDTLTLLKAAVVGWGGDGYDGVPVNDGNLKRLDEKTTTWAAQEIIDLTRPPSEEEEGNA